MIVAAVVTGVVIGFCVATLIVIAAVFAAAALRMPVRDVLWAQFALGVLAAGAGVRLLLRASAGPDEISEASGLFTAAVVLVVGPIWFAKSNHGIGRAGKRTISEDNPSAKRVDAGVAAHRLRLSPDALRLLELLLPKDLDREVTDHIVTLIVDAWPPSVRVVHFGPVDELWTSIVHIVKGEPELENDASTDERADGEDND